jgi:hypothetical protein
MTPDQRMNVLDAHGGFTAVTLSPTHERYGNGWRKVWRESNTLWRPGQLLKQTTIGTLQEYNEKSFFQNNNDVTKAYYKVPGYRFRVAVWFDNATGRRLA